MIKSSIFVIVGIIALFLLVIGLLIDRQFQPGNGAMPVPTLTPQATATMSPSPVVSPSGASDLIRVTSPQSGQVVTGSIPVTGEARGPWYFEATFPIHVEDSSGKTVFSSFAQAQGEWMTKDFVPFQSQLDIPGDISGPFTLILSKSNPSGLPEHYDSVRIPIIASP